MVQIIKTGQGRLQGEGPILGPRGQERGAVEHGAGSLVTAHNPQTEPAARPRTGPHPGHGGQASTATYLGRGCGSSLLLIETTTGTWEREMTVVMKNSAGEIERWESWAEFVADISRKSWVVANGDCFEVRDSDDGYDG